MDINNIVVTSIMFSFLLIKKLHRRLAILFNRPPKPEACRPTIDLDLNQGSHGYKPSASTIGLSRAPLSFAFHSISDIQCH